MDDPHSLIGHLSDSIFVILLKDDRGHLTLLADPGIERPWSSKNRRLAEFHASQCNGMAETWGNAFRLLLKENPNFEKELNERVQRNADTTFRGIRGAGGPPADPSDN